MGEGNWRKCHVIIWLALEGGHLGPTECSPRDFGALGGPLRDRLQRKTHTARCSRLYLCLVKAPGLQVIHLRLQNHGD